MNRSTHKQFWLALYILAGFTIWTVIISLIDVQPIGPLGSAVGLAHLNRAFHTLTGVHWTLYHITDALSLVPLGFVMSFTLLGLVQWRTRRQLQLVDRSLLVLGIFYLIVAAVYVFFEQVVVNTRPVLIDGNLEASYPSSTTLLVLCVMPTAIMQCRKRIHRHWRRYFITAALTAFTVFMVIGRLLSGVHWLTDIIGGALLSAGLVLLYRCFSKL